jgi:16S rRNA (cytosine967-C5)-methyltransferase
MNSSEAKQTNLKQATPAMANPRLVALNICQDVVLNRHSLTSLLEQWLPSLSSQRDQGFCSELCYGFCRFYFVLYPQLLALLKKPFRDKDRDLEIVLILGMYQVRFTRVSDHAAVNETVKLLKPLRKLWAKGLVNGILRNFIRALDGDGSSVRDSISEQEQTLAYPNWLRDRIIRDWDDLAKGILRSGNQRANMMLRIDTATTSREDYLELLQQHHIAAESHALVESAIVLQVAQVVATIPGFEAGMVSVQDASAQLAAPLLACQPGMRVLDACAAPGGKTLHILQHTADLSVVALDKDQTRLGKVAENLKRAGQHAKLLPADAAHPEIWHDGQPFDRILLDAPCSASGIIRRHPDIRLLRRSEDVSDLVRQQRSLLKALWPLLKPGGRMLYSTCSIFKQENELQVADFLKARSDCVESKINSVQWGVKRPVGRQIFPGHERKDSDMDGFYYAVLEKQA